MTRPWTPEDEQLYREHVPGPYGTVSVTTEDGYKFWMQPNGSMTSHPNPEEADLTFESLEEFRSQVHGSFCDCRHCEPEPPDDETRLIHDHSMDA